MSAKPGLSACRKCHAKWMPTTMEAGPACGFSAGWRTPGYDTLKCASPQNCQFVLRE